MSFLKASLFVALVATLGRVSGFLRELVIAGTAGASLGSDVIIVLLTFPDLMLSLLLGGGLTAALVPAFKSLPKEESFALLFKAIIVICIIFSLVTMFLALNVNFVINFLAPGWSEKLIEDIKPRFSIMLIALPVAAVSSVLVSFLNSQEKFSYDSIGTIIFNISIIASLIILNDMALSSAVVLGIIGGALLRLVVQLIPFRSLWHKPNFSTVYRYRGLLRRFVYGFGFFSILSLLIPMARAYASLFDAGAISIFNFAHKLIELPMAIVVTAISTVMLSRLAGYVSEKDETKSVDILGNSLRFLIVALLAIALPTLFHAESIARIVFYGARFTDQQFIDLGLIFTIGISGLPIQGLVILYGTALISYDATRPLFIAALIMVASNLILGYFLSARFGLAGVMISYVFTHCLGAFYLTFKLIKVTGPKPFLLAFKKPVIRFGLPSILCIILSWIFLQFKFWTIPSLLFVTGFFIIIHLATDYKFICRLTRKRRF